MNRNDSEKKEKKGDKTNSPFSSPAFCNSVVIFTWYIEHWQRFFCVVFDDEDCLIGGYSYPKGEEDPKTLMCCRKEVNFPIVDLLSKVPLKVDEDKI